MKIDPNNVPEGAVALPVSDGTWTLVDADVAEALAGKRLFRMCAGYITLPSTGGGILLHQAVAGIRPGYEIHHRNGDRDDNRRENLAHLSRGDHRRLEPGGPRAVSGFSGVQRIAHNSYRAMVSIDRKGYNRTLFREPLLAAMCRDDYLATHGIVGARVFERSLRPRELRPLLESSGGRFFTVWFVKRSDGTIRRMNCRLRNKPDSQGLKFDPRAAGLLTVWDVEARAYRCINLEGVLCLRMEGKSYRVERRRALAA